MTLFASLRSAYQTDGFSGFMIPRADRHQNETPPACDERLAFATGFTGSAGLAIVLDESAALFVDGRYETQAATQTDPDQIETVATRLTRPSAWLVDKLTPGQKLAYDPWLHSVAEIEELQTAIADSDARLEPAPRNYLDPLWLDRPGPPTAPARAQSDALSGESAASKRERIGANLADARLDAAILSDPTTIAWLLNIRGGDTPNTPITLAYAILKPDGRVALFTDPGKFDAALITHLGDAVSLEDWAAFEPALDAMSAGRIGVDRAGAPAAISARIRNAGAEVVWRRDPCVIPRARKNATELAGARAAHVRDSVAMCRFLAWLEAALGAQSTERLDEAEIGARLRAFRAETAAMLGSELVDESFASIVAWGANAALPHYRAPETGSAVVEGDGLLLIDSGGQYPDGTTDVTRTIAIGAPTAEMRCACARVMQGVIAISELRFPEKTEGRALDSFARAALWRAGLDYDHGTGHGVGSFLSVHEGPQSLSKRGAAILEEGMILSNEPGRYKPGAFGVRIETLVIVAPAEIPTDALAPGEPEGDRKMHRFETLTLIPIDRRTLEPSILTADDRAWIDAYHARILREIGPLLASGPSADPAAAAWLATACAPL